MVSPKHLFVGSATKFFGKPYRLSRHEKTCNSNVKHKFPGFLYKIKKTIFEKLQYMGFVLEDNDNFFPYFTTWDLESFQTAVTNYSELARLQWLAEHVPASISVASKVPGYENAHCFVTTCDSKQLVSEFVRYIFEISDTSYPLLKEKFENVFSELDVMLNNLPDEDEEGKAQLFKLKKKFDLFLKEMPVLGFNSSRYDINVIKQFLFKEVDTIELEEDEGNGFGFVVKRNNAYMCLKTDRLKFLDICNYLAPGYSYDQFLKAYECTAQKGFFPYEWCDSIDKLEFGQLPHHEAFFSALRNTNITLEEYEYCCSIWRDCGMESFRDYLIWYNNLDVEPFVEAVGKMFQFYQRKNLDLFKDGISVPGLVMKYMFSGLDANTYFSLFQERDKDLYYELKKTLLGDRLLFSIAITRETKHLFRTLKIQTLERLFRFRMYFPWSKMTKRSA